MRIVKNAEGNIARTPVLMDFNRYGQVNWQKVMSIDTSANVYIKDLQETPDGGYIMAGFKFSPAPQQSWIVKVDADGNTCWVADCYWIFEFDIGVVEFICTN